MSYIEREKVLEQFKSLEQLARKRVYDTPTNSPAYERYCTQLHERERTLSIIKAQPTADVVEVVRCKDCKHYKGEQSNCWLMRVKMQPTDYCSYGERISENEG